MRTPLGPSHSVLIREVSLFQGLFNICKILQDSALPWMSLFRGFLQGRVPLYVLRCITLQEQYTWRTFPLVGMAIDSYL